MAEVAKQIGPLAQQVSTLGNTIERLYNSNGGPPGFLQTARDVDNGRFDMIFSMFQEFKDDIKPLKKFMSDHISKEEQRADDLSDHNRRMNVKLVVLGLVFSAVSILSANMQGCRNAAHSFFSTDQVNHSENTPQISIK